MQAVEQSVPLCATGHHGSQHVWLYEGGYADMCLLRHLKSSMSSVDYKKEMTSQWSVESCASGLRGLRLML